MTEGAEIKKWPPSTWNRDKPGLETKQEVWLYNLLLKHHEAQRIRVEVIHRGLFKRLRICLTEPLNPAMGPPGGGLGEYPSAMSSGPSCKHWVWLLPSRVNPTEITEDTQRLWESCFGKGTASLNCEGQREYKMKGALGPPKFLL